MKRISLNKRTVVLLIVLLPLVLVFVYVVVSSGPLAPMRVTVKQVEVRSITPSLFGIGIVEAKYRYRVGPTMTGRVLQLNVEVGDRVVAGQILGIMDAVDLDNKIAAKDAAIKKAMAALLITEAQMLDSDARENYAKKQSERHEKLSQEGSVSEDLSEAKYQQYLIAKAGVSATMASRNAAQAELAMLRADYDGLLQQRHHLQLIAPANGLIVGRYIEPGSTVAAAQTVIELIDPKSLWVNVRFNQLQSRGLASNLPANIVLHSQSDNFFIGRVDRVEPLADAVTEEILAKVVFDQLPENIPSVGELAEVTVSLQPTEKLPVVPNASIKFINGQTGVWIINDDKLQYIKVTTGVSDLEGNIQIVEGLSSGDKVVVYSEKELNQHSRIQVVEQLVNKTVNKTVNKDSDKNMEAR